MNDDELFKAWHEEETMAFSGWDFSHLNSRWQQEPIGWDYETVVRTHLKPDDRLLDMGTGGGEFLLTLGHPDDQTSVTEAWKPNILLCMEKLAPLGIAVYPVTNDGQLPIPDHSFDIVINRHASYDLREVSRVLRPGGMLITQQVGGENGVSLAERINPEGEPAGRDFSLETELSKLKERGFTVQYADESYPELRFFDVGAVVFWAKIIEWTFPGFSVDRSLSQLRALQEEITEKGYVSVRQHRFIVVAQNRLKR